ncbi:hypothetical protein WMF31_13820 [Sorangium sp. So ce1036]|uniref:hypothetical protein n=1 Tax=Sorangium sp. So ce1036 TaxID=3133328 RepID=UPI003F0028E7
MEEELVEDAGATAEDDEVLLDDPVVARHIERALSPYRGLLPAEALEAMDDLLFVVLTTHPEVRPMVDRLRRAARVERSGTRASPACGRAADGATLPGDARDRPTGAGGRRRAPAGGSS